MERFPREFLDGLRDAAPVLRHLGLPVERDFCSPFREGDDNPSCHYSPESGLVTDFGTDRRYDALDVVGALEGIADFAARVERVAEIAGVPVQREVAGTPVTRQRRGHSLFEPFPEPQEAGWQADASDSICKAQADLFGPQGEAARAYLRMRGIDDADAERFGLGFTTNPRELHPSFSVYEPNAKGFIVVPFLNGDGSIIYSMLRTVPGPERPTNKEWRPKGTKSPLYREHLLAQGRDVVAVVEGLVDAWSFEKMCGIPAVGLGSTSMTRRLASVLCHTPQEARPRKVVVCMDGDDAGKAASAKIKKDLIALGIAHSVMELPVGEDPNSMLLGMNSTEWVLVKEAGEENGARFTTEWR